MTVAAVIFDMDGLMVDTEPLYQAAWQGAASECGYRLDDSFYATLIGRPMEACERLLLDRYGPSFPLARFRSRWPLPWRVEVDRSGIQIKPGLTELLAFLEERQVPMAVATSSDAAYAKLTLTRIALTNRFRAVVTGDQVECGKPAPDIYLEAARRLGVHSGECVALEDSEAGIRAVRRAGMIGLLVPHVSASAEAVLAAHHVVETLHDARQVLAAMLGDRTCT
jgi:HAD superfamily hydrolase (TIGR01509 family)